MEDDQVNAIRPPLDQELFPVHRPSGLKRAYWNFFFKFQFFFFLLYFPALYILVYSGQETIIHLRVALLK